MAGCFEHFGNSEVSDLDRVVAGEEYILRFDVAVDDASAVHIIQRETDLHKPVEDFQFSEHLVFLLFALDVVRKVANYNR